MFLITHDCYNLGGREGKGGAMLVSHLEGKRKRKGGRGFPRADEKKKKGESEGAGGKLLKRTGKTAKIFSLGAGRRY